MSVFHSLTCATGTKTSNASSTNQRGRPKNRLRAVYKRHIKLPYSYVEMITMVIKSSSSGKLTLKDITDIMQDKFHCFRGEYVGWKNSVRHNLSVSECFTKVLRNPSRPYAKGNFWIMNEECEHCKINREKNATSDKLLPVYCTPIVESIPPLSPVSSESAAEPADIKTKLLNHPTTEMSSCQRMSNGTNNATSEAHYDDTYYDQHSYTAHDGTRRHHRYHPYTPPHRNHWQQGRHPAAQQGTNTVDDLANLEDLYVPAHDIDFSKLLNKEQPEYHVPYATYHPTGFQSYVTPSYNPYEDDHLPTYYQLPPLSQGQYDWQRATTVDSMEDVFPYPYDFVPQACEFPSLPSSPSSIHSSDSSSTYLTL